MLKSHTQEKKKQLKKPTTIQAGLPGPLVVGGQALPLVLQWSASAFGILSLQHHEGQLALKLEDFCTLPI